MALYDFASKFCNKQDISGADETIVATDNINLTVDDRGKGVPLTVLVQLNSLPTGGTSVQFILADSPDDGSYAAIQSSEVYTTAQLVALEKGVLRFTLPGIHEQYVQLQFALIGTYTVLDATAGILKD